MKAGISKDALASIVESRLCSDEGGDDGAGVVGFEPKSDAKGLVIRDGTELLFEGPGRPAGRGGSGGLLDAWERGGRWSAGEYWGIWNWGNGIGGIMSESGTGSGGRHARADALIAGLRRS